LAEIEDRLEELVLERDRLQNGTQSREPAREKRLQADITAALGRRAVLQKRLKAGFNPFWESLFKEGRSASRFGRQVQEFACIYTSAVSNFLAYPVNKFFARPAEILPHERWTMP
jgi:hypothetical protein